MAKTSKSLVLSGNIIEKRNVLNEMWAIGWTLQELRFFALYLSKINARKQQETRKVRLSLYEFADAMGLKRIQPKDIESSADSLLQKIATIPKQNEDGVLTGGISKFQLFKKCVIEKNEYGEWYIEFDAHDDALPLMFDFIDKYVTYNVINVLRLKGENHIRMYEILKQYEKIGKTTLPLTELRGRLGIEPNEYSRWSDFKRWVLDECQKALAENTDIKYTYEPIKKGRGGKTSPVVAVKFIIKQNDRPEQLSLLDSEVVQTTTKEYSDLPLKILAEAFDFRFDDSQMKIIQRELNKFPIGYEDIFDQYRFLRDVCLQLNYRRNKKENENDPIKEDFSYALGIIKNKLMDIEKGKKL